MSAERRRAHLTLLGGCALASRDGAPLAGRVAQRRRLAFLVLVASTGRGGITRDRLVALLWPESASEPARHRLADTLHVLRAALGEEALPGIGDRVALDPEVVTCDVREFEDALRRGDADAAVGAYGGPFLDGFHVRDAPEFERWADAERERLARDLARALEGLATRSTAAGDHGAAVGWWRRLAAHEPYSARVVLRLMGALDATGDRAGAIRHAEVHATLMREEVGAEPDAEVLALAERLRRPAAATASAAPPVGASEAPPASSSFEPPSVARAPEVTGVPEAPATDVADVPAARPADGARRGEGEPAADAPDGVGRAAASPRRRASGRPTAASRRGAWSAAAGLALVAVGVLAVVGSRAVAGSSDGAALPESLVVADFENRAGDSTLASTVTEALRIDLARSPRLVLPSAQHVHEGLALMRADSTRPLTAALALTLARRLEAKAVLEGAVGTAGRGFVLTARLVAAADGRTVETFRTTATDSSEVIGAIDRLSRAVRGAVGDSMPALGVGGAGRWMVTTSSLPALAALLRAAHASNAADWLALAEHAREAAALDPDFAEAHRRLGVALDYLGVRRAERVRALTRAYALRERLSRYEQGLVEATYFSHVLGDDRRSAERYRILLAEFPFGTPGRRGTIPRNNLYEAYHRLGEPQLAARVSRALVDTVPEMLGHHVQHVQALLALGRLDAADSAVRSMARESPGQWRVALAVTWLAAARREYARALAVVDSVLGAPAGTPPSGRTALLQQQRAAAAATGRLGVLDRADAELARTYARLDAAPELLRTAAERAELDATLGLPDRARQRLEQALARHPLAPMAALDRPYAALAAAWAAAGRPDRAEVLLAQWADDVAKEHQPLDARAVLRARIVTRLAQGRASDAERLAREGHFGACAGCADLYLARAFDARGSTDSTIAAYERYLAATSEREQLDARELARAYRRLGELYDARADGARALRSVGDFVTLWQHADPALQPAVDAARQRIRRP